MLAIREAFNIDNESLFLTQPGCKCLSVKYGLDRKLLIHVIFIALDAARNETIIHNLDFGLKDNEGYFVELAFRCLPDCPTKKLK
jgi:hypothetical protein